MRMLNLYKMKEIVDKFLLAGDKYMPEMHLNNLDLLIALVDHFLKTRKEFKNLKKQDIQAIFAKTNLIRHAFNLAYTILKI